MSCQLKLRYKLNVRTGLLCALNVRYASFYFTSRKVVMHIMPYHSSDIYTYDYPRSPGSKPAEDFSRMANSLGRAWWEEKQRTNKRYLASRRVLALAQKNDITMDSVKPNIFRKPTNVSRSLTCLKLSEQELYSPQLERIIKTAYRRQAMKHHPDHGGDSSVFLKINQAYEQLINWAENPTFSCHRGFPDKWFYDGSVNKWTQPTPHR